jgi:hypothetical protein
VSDLALEAVATTTEQVSFGPKPKRLGTKFETSLRRTTARLALVYGCAGVARCRNVGIVQHRTTPSAGATQRWIGLCEHLIIRDVSIRPSQTEPSSEILTVLKLFKEVVDNRSILKCPPQNHVNSPSLSEHQMEHVDLACALNVNLRLGRI